MPKLSSNVISSNAPDVSGLKNYCEFVGFQASPVESESRNAKVQSGN